MARKSASKPNKAQRELAAQWEALVKSQSRPLERGAKAKAVKASGKAPSKMPQLTIPTERSSRNVASVDSGKGSASLAQPPQYTGNKVIGLATMHKSNMVPIFNNEAAEDVAKMRR